MTACEEHDWDIAPEGCACGDDNCLVVCPCGAENRACEE